MIRLLPMLLLLLSGPARAEDIVIESQPYIERGDAVLLHSEIVQALPDGSTATARLVRRFHQGQGWRYVVVIEGATTRAEADALARLVTGLTVFSQEPASEPAPALDSASRAREEGAAEPRVAQPRDERLMSADAVLRAAVRAHGGSEGAGVLIDQAQSIRFSYTRTVPESGGNLVATNHFFRSGSAARLEVEITSGTGQNSVTILTADHTGWVSVGDGYTERDSGRTLEILERFSPEAVLAVPLGLPEDVETASVWRSMRTSGRSGAGGDAVWILKGEEDSGLQEATFDVQQHLLRRVTWSAEPGDITFTYDDYQELARDLIIPFHTRIERDGTMIEEITVLSFEVNPVLDGALFMVPR
jgi:hypothetical protein